MSPERQAAEVRKVKRFEAGVISEPITVGPDDDPRCDEPRRRARLLVVPVVEAGVVVGILTDATFAPRPRHPALVRDVMTQRP